MADCPRIPAHRVLDPDPDSDSPRGDPIANALRERGYLMLISATATIDAAFSSWHRFRALPHAVRTAFRRTEIAGRSIGGWLELRDSPVYMSHMNPGERAAAEPKEQFGCSADENDTRWPAEADCPGFSRDVTFCLRRLDHIARALLGATERLLGEPTGYLRYSPGYLALSTHPGTEHDEATHSLDEHSDATVFTLLAQRSRALQLRDRDGQWVDAPPQENDDILVIAGDWLELMTNGEIPAVRHRVLGTPYSRSSLAYFQSVAPMPIGPRPRFVSAARPARYPTVPSDIPYAGGASGVPRWKTHRAGA